jgi:hypothetical protein
MSFHIVLGGVSSETMAGLLSLKASTFLAQKAPAAAPPRECVE